MSSDNGRIQAAADMYRRDFVGGSYKALQELWDLGFNAAGASNYGWTPEDAAAILELIAIKGVSMESSEINNHLQGTELTVKDFPRIRYAWLDDDEPGFLFIRSRMGGDNRDCACWAFNTGQGESCNACVAERTEENPYVIERTDNCFGNSYCTWKIRMSGSEAPGEVHRCPDGVPVQPFFQAPATVDGPDLTLESNQAQELQVSLSDAEEFERYTELKNRLRAFKLAAHQMLNRVTGERCRLDNVWHQTTFRALLSKPPATRTQFLNTLGLGPYKWVAFGPQLLRALDLDQPLPLNVLELEQLLFPPQCGTGDTRRDESRPPDDEVQGGTPTRVSPSTEFWFEPGEEDDD